MARPPPGRRAARPGRRTAGGSRATCSRRRGRPGNPAGPSGARRCQRPMVVDAGALHPIEDARDIARQACRSTLGPDRHEAEALRVGQEAPQRGDRHRRIGQPLAPARSAAGSSASGPSAHGTTRHSRSPGADLLQLRPVLDQAGRSAWALGRCATSGGKHVGCGRSATTPQRQAHRGVGAARAVKCLDDLDCLAALLAGHDRVAPSRTAPRNSRNWRAWKSGISRRPVVVSSARQRSTAPSSNGSVQT